MGDNGDYLAQYEALTSAQRDALRVLVSAARWVETWRRGSKFEPYPRVNHNAVNPLIKAGLAEAEWGYSGQQKARATQAGRDLITGARVALTERGESFPPLPGAAHSGSSKETP